MTHAHQPDLGPLNWVKGEIDLALGRAAEALDQAAASPEPGGALQFAQTHLHQARGALSIVGLDGLTQFADSLDRLLAAQARGELAAGAEHIQLARRALAALGNYLDELAHGAPDQPLRLAALYAEIGRARGEEGQPADLFFPDLSLRPPARAEDPVALPAEDELKHLKALRGRFERGLLKWLRSPAEAEGPREMREAVAGIEARQTSPAVRSLWWASLAFFDGLMAGPPSDLAATRKLCTRLDAQMRRLLAGSPPANDRVMRELLHHVATHPANTEHQRQVCAVFGLAGLLPEPGTGVRDVPLGPIVARLRDTLVHTREAWDRFSAGTAAALPQFAERMASLGEQAGSLGRPALSQLLDGLGAFTAWLRRDPLQLTSPLALEVASALLLAESALEASQLPANLGLRVDESIARIQAHMRGQTPSADLSEAAAEAARRDEEREATAHLARELLTTLAQVEQGLDAFFRDPARREPLAAVRGPLTQLSGALTLLEDPAPQALVEASAATIRGYLEDAAEPDPASFETLAQSLSALGFYLEALRQGPARLSDFLPGAAVPAPVEEAPAPAVEAPPAPVVVEVALPEEEPEVAEPAPIPPPSAQAQALMAAPEEALDAELLAIFIEEAQEVLATMAEQLALSRSNPADLAALTTVRRGFHTLKGSGRMVGLKDLGEAAWALEQTLNRWLQLEWVPTPALHQLIDAAHQRFAEWVAQLAAGGPAGKDVHELVAEAERLRESETPIDEPAIELPAPSLSPEGEAMPVAEALESLDFDLDIPELGEAEEMEAEPPLVLAEEIGLEADFEELEALPAEAPAAEPAIELPAPSLSQEGEGLPVVEALESPDFDLDIPELGEAEATEGEPPLVLAEEIGLEAEFEELEALPAEAPAGEPGTPGLSEDDLEELELAQLNLEEATAAAPRADLPLDSDEVALEDYLDSLTPIPVPEFRNEAPATASAPRVLALDALGEEEPGLEALEEGPEGLEGLEALEGLDTLEGLEALEEEPFGMEASAPEDIPSDLVRLGDAEISRPLYDLFLAEASQHLATLRRELARLHVNPTLLPPEPAIRAAHTLAGIAGTAQVQAAQQLARALEQAQSRLHDGGQAPNQEQTEVLITAAANLEAMVAQVAEGRLPLAAPELVEQLEGVARIQTAEIRPFTLIQGEGRGTAVARPGPELAPAAPPAAPEVAPTPAVHDDIDEQLLPHLLEEGEELLGQIAAALRAWREEPAAPAHPDNLARMLHTLKGSVRMAGAMVLGEFLHQLEGRLEGARARPGPALIDDIESAMDSVEQMLHGLGAPAAAAGATSTAVAMDSAEGEAGAATPTLRLRADLVDRFVNEAGEIGIARTRVEGELRTLRRSLLDLTENVIRLRNQLREVEIQAEMQMHSRIAHTESRHGDFDPLEMDRYTRLQELTRMMAESVGDMTTVQQSLLRNLDSADAAVTSQARLSRDLQQALMQVRMVRFDSLADRLYRVVRQSAKDLGKRANLDLRGGAIGIDRGVLEHMTAPLEHLLRNAVAHGIENAAARQAAGKAEIGQITLSVSQEGNEIVLDLADDGAGLDFQRILAKARAQGLLGPDEEADEKHLTNLIFVPGFSTAGSVSAVSGRGVGMDVVKAETASVGGRIDVYSTPASGTRFRIYLPLTLAVTQALLVRAAHHSYAIPSSMVAQVLELRPEALQFLQKEGATEWMGERFSYRYLPRLLGDGHSQPELHKFNWVLLLRAGAQTLALHVDGLRGNQEIVVKNAGPQLARIIGMSGATVLGDGEIVLILNPVALASRNLPAGDEAVSPGVIPMERGDYQPTVLVVDDSLTVRKITGRLLEREGYRVLTAKDGVDAMEKLLDETPDVILSDIEMPRMDGFDLLRNIRADQRLSAVPVIMITSRLAEKHRRYAEEIGANHYLGKPYQEEELLGLIRGYVGEAAAA